MQLYNKVRGDIEIRCELSEEELVSIRGGANTNNGSAGSLGNLVSQFGGLTGNPSSSQANNQAAPGSGNLPIMGQVMPLLGGLGGL